MWWAPNGVRLPGGYFRLLFAYTLHMSRYDRPSHRVYMTFFYWAGWYVQFLEADAKTPLPRTFTFTDPEKIRELARRGEAWGDSIAGRCWNTRSRTGGAAAICG